MTLKPDTSWADGHGVDAADLCFSIDVLLDPANDVPWAEQHRDVLAGCEVSSDRRSATVVFQAPVPSPRDWLGIPILPEHAFEGTAIEEDHPFATHAFGTLNTRATLEPDRLSVERVGGAPPQIAGFEIRPDLTLEDVRQGSAHGLVRIPVDALADARAQDDLIERRFESQALWSVAIRRRGALADRDTRVALDRAIDRGRLLLEVWGMEDDDPLSPVSAVRGPYLESSPFSDRSVRTREPSAAPLALGPLRLGMSEAHASLAPGLAEAIAEQLRERGVAVEVVEVPGTPPRPGAAGLDDLDLMVVRWLGRPPNHVRPLFAADGSHNPFGVHSPGTDAALEALEAATTDTDYQDAAHALHRIAHEEVHALWLVSGGAVSMWRPEVRNNAITPLVYWAAFGQWKLDR